MAKIKMGSGGRSIVCFWVAALMIIFCAVTLNNLLAHAEEAESSVKSDEGIQAEYPASSDVVDEGSEISYTAVLDEHMMPENLNTIIYDGGVEMPEGSVSAQYAIATAAEFSKNEYGKEFTGRVFCHLGRQTTAAVGEDYNPNPHWGITAEVDGGQASVYIDAITGAITSGDYYEGETDFEWFDTWTEDDVEKLGPVTS